MTTSFAKSLIVATLIFVGANSAMAGIVNNSTSSFTAADSICLSFALLDSIGSVTAVDSAADWFKIFVFNPAGDSVFGESLDVKQANAQIEIYRVATQDAMWTYKREVEDFDGSNVTQNGVWRWYALARDSSLKLTTSWTGEFQLVTQGDFEDILDSAAVQAQEIWTATGGDSVLQALDYTNNTHGVLREGLAGVDADTGIAAIKTKLTTIAGYTDDIGVAGAGLTAIPLNLDLATGTLSDAQIDLLTVTLPSDSLALIHSRLVALLTDTSQALSSADSALISRISRRMWGIQLGAAGSTDSATIGQRTVSVDSIFSSAIRTEAFTAGAITKAVIADAAIGAGEIETDAIGSSELAASAIMEILDSLRASVLSVAEADSLIAQVKDVRDSVHGNTFSATGGTPTITAAQFGSMADSVWAKDTSNALWNGLSRFGEYNALAQAATATIDCDGAGLVICTLDVRNASGGLGGVTVTINNTSNVFQYQAVSNANGFVYFNLDQSTTYRIVAGGLAGSVHDSLPYQTLVTTTATNKRDTVPMTTESIPAPTISGYKRVWGREYINNSDSTSGPASGILISATLSYRQDPGSVIPQDTLNDNNLGKQVTVYARTNVNGYWQLDVPINTNILPVNSWWQFTAQNRWSVGYRFTTTTTARLSSLTGF